MGITSDIYLIQILGFNEAVPSQNKEKVPDKGYVCRKYFHAEGITELPKVR